jgi:hypothetical protein
MALVTVCSFCGGSDAARTLAYGPGVAICRDCANAAIWMIMDSENRSPEDRQPHPDDE